MILGCKICHAYTYVNAILQIIFGIILVMSVGIGKHRKRTVFHGMFCICSGGFAYTTTDLQKCKEMC